MAEAMFRLQPLKTLHETRSNDQFVEAFVVEIPAKLTSKALGIVKPVVPNDRTMSFHHLRRLCTLSHLPLDLTWRRDYDSNGLQTVFLLLPSTIVPWETICAALAPHIDVQGLPRCFNTIVPRYAPLTAEQAVLWSERYWPTIFNPASQVLQDAPPLHQLRRVQAELDTPLADTYMNLARQAAQEARNSTFGRPVGAVVVDPATQEVIAVAGDARWWSKDSKLAAPLPANRMDGRPEQHALMRVIAMVANKELRRRLQAGSHSRFAATCSETPAGETLHPIETGYANGAPTDLIDKPDAPENLQTTRSSRSSSVSSDKSASRSDGYLCSNLDVYLTHEPCVCCAMAMIHSRFRACVFDRRMPGTGSLSAEAGHNRLGYGLFWRRELNWRAMTFQYKGPAGYRNPIATTDNFHA